MSSPHQTSPKNVTEKERTAPPETVKGRKMMNVKVIFLDDSNHTFQIQGKTSGRVLFDKVCKFLNLFEVDYFGLEYEDERSTKYWLDCLKPMCRQVGLTNSSPTMHFCVKFYTPDPVQLEDEFTRYLLSLQLKKDLASGVLQCNDNTAALMISYIVQADCGDYDLEEFPEHSYLSSYKFVPYQDANLERKIMENHKKHMSQTPAEADLNLLETARRCELYGIKMTAAKDHEGVPLNLAVAHVGVLVFQNYTKINTFSWAKIRKLSFKRKRFLIKLHPEGYGYIKDTVEFYFEGRNECKNFWKKCIENHTFFRCTDAKKGMRQRPKFFSRGSSFRYSGRTQMQVSEFVRENYVKRPFQRSTSLRTTNSSPSGPVGASISAQPLLPVSTSFSCSSVAAMTEAPSPSLPPKKLSASEPTTPHVAPDISNALTNGSVIKLDTQKQGTVTGLTTPDDYDCDPEGLQSPDCLGQDTDDNISHDSYQVTDKEESKVQNLKNGIDTVVHYKTNDIDLAPSELVNEMADSQDVPPSLQLKTNNGKVKYEKCDILENNNNLVIKPCFSDSGDAPELIKQIIALSHENMKSIETRDQNISQVCSHSDAVTYANIEPAVKTDTGQINSRLQSHCDLGRSGNESKSQSLNSVLNGDSSVYSERSEDSDNNCLEENSGSFIDTLQSLGVPSFCIDSFGTLAESRILNYNKKTPNDRAYFIAKELLMTERTYRRDLEIVDVVFREEFRKQGSMPSEAVEAMLSIVDPLYEVHCSFLRELEQRMAFWEGRPVKADQNEVKGIGDIFLHHIRMSKLYETYAEQLPYVLKQLSAALESSQRFAVFYQQFETHKMCYLPLTSFLLRPLYRLTHYCYVLKDVTDRYENIHFDYESCKDTLTELQETFANFENKIPSVINYVKLVELERNLTGFPNLIQSDRLFIREGCLQKLSKNGNHQRMFFLFSDILLYTTRIMTEKLHFRVYGCLALADLKVQEAEPRQGSSYCFTIFKDDKCLLLAASSEKERNKWLKDLKDAIQVAKIKGFISTYSSQFSLDNKSESGDGGSSLDIRNEDKPISHHVNTSVHVCWHRNISVSRYDLLVSVQHSLSGFLLRKFKNNNGWQKLWVVLSSLCLFFYKSYLDDSPLASLPLAGYRVLTPSPEDPITKDHVFKLQYKNHAYFFRAESEHIFDRWMAVIHYATLADEEKTYL